METVKLATGIGGHGPQMLYSGGRQHPAGHPAGPQVIHPSSTRSYDGQYKGAISPPLGTRGTAYPGYPVVDGRHSGPRYIQQSYLPTYPRDNHYATPITDRPVLLPHAPRRPSIMGSYPYSAKDMVQVLNTPSLSMSSNEPYKRIKLTQSLRSADVRYSPLLIDTNENHTSRESSYYPQVEAISPTLPPDPRDESPLHSTSADLIKQLELVDKELGLTESGLSGLRKKEKELEAAAQKGESQSQKDDDDSKDTRHQSTAQIIYAENRKLALESHASLNKLIPTSEVSRVLPLYHQPSDCTVYQQNKRKYVSFKQTLLEHLKRRQDEKNSNNQKLVNSYNNLMSRWLTNIVDKVENSKKHKEKVCKSRELFEKVFPELRKQREDKERFSRVGARVKSDAEMEEIMDGLQEQENEDKKMRAYAVIPPVMLDENERKYEFINKNGLIENPLEGHKQNKYVNIWTEQECEIFKEKYLQHPKNFVIISSYLEKKSVSDAVHHYYLTKKKENYKMLVKRRMRRPRTKNQAQMEAMHLNTRVRTRGAAAKDIKSEPTDDIKHEEEIAMNGTEEGVWHNQTTINSMDTDEPPIKIESSNNSTQLTEKDKENLRISENILPKKEISEEVDTSEEETNSESVPHDCFVCKTRVENFSLSRRIKATEAANYGLVQSQIPPDARVCTNCRCRSVRRNRICVVPSCSAPKRKVKRLKTLPSRWNTLSPTLKDPIIKEMRLPNDLTKCCLYCFNRIMNKIGPEVSEPVDISKWSDDDIEKYKIALSEVGCNWIKISEKVNGKGESECKAFYNTFKENYKLDVIVSEYKKSKGKSSPPTVTDEEESGSSSSSCDETELPQHPPAYPPPQVRHDSASDTLSASSPPVNCVEDSKEPIAPVKEATTNPREDYDSSATTLSADEVVERDSPPEVEHIPHPGEKKRMSRIAPFPQNQEGEVFQDIISKTINATLLSGSEKNKAPQNRDITMESILQKSSYSSYDQESGLDLSIKKRDRSPDRMQSHPSLNHRPEGPPPITVKGGAQVTLAKEPRNNPPQAHSNSISYLPSPAYNAQDFSKSYIDQRSTPQATATGVSSPLMMHSSQSRPPVKSYKPMAPPISVTVSSPNFGMSQSSLNQSQRRIHKPEKTGTISGSITRGTPVNQPSHHPSSVHSSRYDLVPKTVVSTRDSGSITQGTPIMHEKKTTSIQHIKDNVIDSRGGVELISRQPHEYARDYRQRGTVSSQSSTPAGYPFPPYPNYQARPSYSPSDPQVSSREVIRNDFILSQQMIGKNAFIRRDTSPHNLHQKDTRNYSTSERRPETIIERRPGNKEVEMRPIDSRSMPIDKSRKVHLMRSAPVNIHNYYPNRTASPSHTHRDATPTPPSSETNREYMRPVNTTHISRSNSVIQNSNKIAQNTTPERFSPHSVIPSDYHLGKPLDSTSSVVLGSGHQRPMPIYEQRPPSTGKIVEDSSYKMMPPKRIHGDNMTAQVLLDGIINSSVKRPSAEDMQRYRRENEPHHYLVPELEKRGRSPYQKKEEVVMLKDTNHRSHRDGHSASIQQLSQNVNLVKTSQPQFDSVININREYNTNFDPKKMPNHHSYTRPPVEITRTDVRPSSHLQYDHNLHPLKYSVDNDLKDKYDSKSPHRQSSSRINSEDERRIIRIPQPQQNAFSFIANKLQQILREESPEKDRRTTPIIPRSQPPHQSPQPPSSQSQPNMLSHPSQSVGQIRSNSHYEDELPKKRARLDIPSDMSRPPSRPRSGELKDKQQHKDDVDSPQSGEMVIDENPKDVSIDDKRKYPYGYSGYSQSWSAASNKNGRFQGYEPSVEPVSDDE